MSEWISVEDRLPAYGEPVLIVGNGVTQHITYMLDGNDDEADWFEPYYFEHDDELKVLAIKVLFWMPLPEPPKEG
jgi:hypothetical protein